MDKEINTPKKNVKCKHCGANMLSYWQNMSTGLFSALIKAIHYVHRTGKNSFNISKDLTSLTKMQFSNFQKLRFHGLIAHDPNKKRSWLITKRGGQFLRGEISIPASVHTYRNKVIGHSEAQVKASDFIGKMPMFESEFAREYMGLSDEITTGKLF